MEFSYLCDKGLKRINNQDFSHAEIISSPKGEIGIFVVADGMGGHNKGEVASQMATEVFVESIKTKLKEKDQGDPSNDLRQIIQESFYEANRRVYHKSTTDQIYAGMGTTLVAALSDQTKLTIANAGDSRAYMLRQGQLRQITVDNSYVQELIEEGLLQPSEARSHPDRSRITRAVGTEWNIEVDFYDIELLKNDRILLCSDGLSDMLDEREIEELLCRSHNAQDCCKNLVEAANERGGRDNVTVICLTI